MKDVTLQEVFDRVVTHLLTQKQQSVKCETDQCMYRGYNGLMCAVGCLIPDNLYKLGMDISDDTTVVGLISKYTLDGLFDFKVIDVPHHEFVEFLEELQQLHDRFEPIDWEFELQLIAKRNKLQFRATM